MKFHYLLMKAHSMLSRRISYRALGELGLSSGQPKVLECLLENEGSDQKTIAHMCEIEQATLGGILNRMEAKGLIERRQKEGNRRSLFVNFTPQGKKVALKMEEIFDNADEKIKSYLTDEEFEQLNNLLNKLCGKMLEEGDVKVGE